MLETRQQIAANRERDFEMNRRFEEMTDLAERIGFPVETNIYYDLRGESLYARTDTKSRAFIEQTYQAQTEARNLFTGDQAFEQTRRAHEHQEAIDVERLAKGELAGNVMIKVSKVPDAIVEGRTSIKGYKRDTLRTFVRVYHREGTTVRCKLFSIDQNNDNGLSRVGELAGIQLTDRGSEDILADKVVLAVDEPELFVDAFVERSIQVYDEAVYEQTGTHTRAGSVFETKVDAQSAVESQPRLLREHFAAISSIVGLGINPAAQEDLLEAERQRTAAAISLAARGHHVESTGDSSVATEVQNGNYSRECATATENAMQQGESEGEISMTCPHCGLTTVGDPCAVRIQCTRCDAEVNNGRTVSTGIGRSAALARERKQKINSKNYFQKTSDSETSNRFDKERHVKQLFGEKAVLHTRTILGGVSYEVKDTNSGLIIDTFSDLDRLRQLVV